MNHIVIGVLLGVVAGIIDVIPMVIKKLTWDANISAFAMWIAAGFFISVININIHPALEGILVASITLLPSAILIGWKEPKSLIPILPITFLLGGLLGLSISWLTTQDISMR